MATNIKGIDISRYQGSVDFNKVKASGVEFVMIRCGTGYGQKACKDIKFETYYNQAKAAGLAVGTYFYSYAASESQACLEATWVLDWIKGKTFEYPIVFDMEERSVGRLGKEKVSSIATMFCSTVEAAGYYVSLYSSKSWVESYYTPEVLKRFDLWVAQWAAKCTFTGSYGMWQYTSDGSVPGISGRVDCDIAYKDYPSIIKNAGLNGYAKPEVVVPSEPVVEAPREFKAGDAVVLNNANLYTSYDTPTARTKPLSGTYYIYDGVLFGNRYRITNSASRVNKKPVGLFVTGYVNKEDLV
jgi:GH25 family lysozyme M1 (1,4-beta-N-acetylmuramidase)